MCWSNDEIKQLTRFIFLFILENEKIVIFMGIHEYEVKMVAENKKNLAVAT